MDSFWRLASGSSTIHDFAQDVYVKSNLTTQINSLVKQLIVSVNDEKNILTESTPNISNFLYCIEATFLHGLKEKLTLTKVLINKKRESNRHELDFWPVVLILSHNQVSDSLMKLVNITTDIGRCRAWIRLALNDNLLHSYIEALTNDVSLLHGFYRPSAYLRDKDHMDVLKSFLDNLDSLVFQLSYDQSLLNSWEAECLNLIGVSLPEAPSPVMPAVDALDLINNTSKKGKRRGDGKRKYKVEKTNVESISENTSNDFSGQSCDISDNYLETIENRTETSNVSMDETLSNHEDDKEVSNELPSPSMELTAPVDIPREESRPSQNLVVGDTVSVSGNSLSNKEGWSTLPPNCDASNESETYDAILESYSTTAVLSSTPDLKEFSGFNENSLKPQKSQSKKTSFFRRKKYSNKSGDNLVSNVMDFEVIPKTIVLQNEEPETQEFLMQLTYISNEVGLDEQDYKCYSCGRPVGMLYGKARVCNFDGYNYCLECHSDEKLIIPARILQNWDFARYSVSNKNRDKLMLTESEAFLDIKIMSPILYKAVPAMEECLNLRTQLFYLHAYLFTCQETVAVELRKIVWPREHLYEHIHLYSTSDLTQVQSGTLSQFLKKAIQFARKHVLSCLLCSQKGFICEICKSSQIIYPFDTESTYRCDKCKAVFHSKCVLVGSETKPCPRCLRIQRREQASNS
ncbi:DUF4206 and RUN domain containing protein-like protein [Leptotrombidium deliense]|uniref:DUF4206 and RUN domain containing protein-like protein n=1 Tax=Leptotrombidium deliense TaxID=299467 RepID=A0A443SVY4_9ACAR|nr:DUF4206 and RUN domain containing protein-like protein [Leptotrombidium deliense]